jgi:stage V sporulation protein AE
MNFLLAFLFAGTSCLIAQIILDNTKLIPGHITSIYTVAGAILSFLGIYDKLIKIFGAGATLMITNFGHSLYTGAITGYKDSGFLGLFTGLFTKSSAALTGAIIFAFIISIIFKPKD